MPGSRLHPLVFSSRQPLVIAPNNSAGWLPVTSSCLSLTRPPHAAASASNSMNPNPRRSRNSNPKGENVSASKTPKYVPEFTGPIEGWVVNFLKKNAWRVARTMEFADCIQEAQLVFLRVARTYPDVVDAPHFMALFKTSWTRRFNDLSTDDTNVRQGEVHMEEHEGSAPWQPVGELQNDGELQVMLRQAPREVTMVLNLLLKAPQEMLETLLGSWKGRDRRTKGNGSERINQLLGLPLHQDTLGRVHDYFRADDR